MILGELLGALVLQDGERVGVVVDARLLVPDDGSAPEVVGLVIGPRRGTAFLGYERRSARRPALLAHLFAWPQRGSYLVDVADLSWQPDDRQVVLTSGCTRWSSRLDD
ncbi:MULTISPECIES: hypothetical protein [unclassified Aeromicrobium]|jgi:hypothetical protein|uniref:hypothetical protein n=1 Tax=unclassified Aeromicrobium TaxID=2633570 RepID=UPI000AEDBC72|nr:MULTISPECIES: hypothetical protein [unclassified Aeromicrobium]